MKIRDIVNICEDTPLKVFQRNCEAERFFALLVTNPIIGIKKIDCLSED